MFSWITPISGFGVFTVTMTLTPMPGTGTTKDENIDFAMKA
jgi:hypothetical protein